MQLYFTFKLSLFEISTRRIVVTVMTIILQDHSLFCLEVYASVEPKTCRPSGISMVTYDDMSLDTILVHGGNRNSVKTRQNSARALCDGTEVTRGISSRKKFAQGISLFYFLKKIVASSYCK